MTSHPLRILILGLNYAPELTGNAPYTASLAEGLHDRGHIVRVITTYPHYPKWKINEGYGGWSTRTDENGVPIDRKLHYVPSNPRGLLRLISEVSFGVRLVFARWDRPDVVLLVSPALFSSSLAAMRARLSRRRPVIATWVQDLYSLGITETGQGGRALGALMSKVESSLLRHSTGVAVIHPRFRDYVVKRLNVDAKKVEVIRNWSHLVPPKSVDRDSTRKQLGWRENEVIVLHAGNMGVKQGLENVVAAAVHADATNLPLRFVLMGGGNQRAKLEELAQGVVNVTFLDSLPDDQYQWALASADVLLVNEKPGVAEMAVPSKLTSYYSAGVPVLAATDAGSVTAGELEASDGGIRVDAGNPAGLAEAAYALGLDRALSRKLGAQGRKFREQHLSEDSAIDHYAQWLTRLVAEHDKKTVQVTQKDTSG